MTESELFGQLRETKAFRLDQIIAVFLGSTGDVSARVLSAIPFLTKDEIVKAAVI